MGLFNFFSKKQEENISFAKLQPGDVVEFTLCKNLNDHSGRFTGNELNIRKFSGIAENVWKEPQTKIWMAEVVAVRIVDAGAFVRTFSLHEHEIEKMRLLK
jgi:hypothetical protein